MKIELLLLLPLAGLTLAGPARRDCGMTKSFLATNECGMTYGGTWVECASGVTEMPRFTIPLCSTTSPADANATPIVAVIIGPTPTGVDPLITPAPAVSTGSSPYYANATSTCSPLWMCVDMVAFCGSEQVAHGECYDTCTQSAPSGPKCDAAAATAARSNNNTRAMPILNFDKVDKDAPREQKSWCARKSWMCAPKGW
ncbi:Nn.00g097140.m01.CDS01 [Neocucurbitaria sp. VM-36]